MKDAPNEGIVLSVQLGMSPSCVTRGRPMIIGSAAVGWCSRGESPPLGDGMLSGTVMHPNAAASFDVHGRDLHLKFVGNRFRQVEYLSEEL